MQQTACMLMAFALATANISYAQQNAKKSKPLSLKQLQDLANPGPEHKVLADYSGTWDVTISLGSGNTSQVFTGISKIRMVAKGRFLVCEFDATGKDISTEGIFTLGFDRRRSGDDRDDFFRCHASA